MMTGQKTAGEVLKFTVNWTDWLDGDTISTVTWTLDSGITKSSETNTTTSASVLISSGTVGATYEVMCKITTAAGLTGERTFKVSVVSKKYD